MSFIVGLVVGLFIGAFGGVLVMALMFAASAADDHAIWKCGGDVDD